MSTVLAAAATALLIAAPAPPGPSVPVPPVSALPVPSTTAPAVSSFAPAGDPGAATRGRSWRWPLTPRPAVVNRFAVGPETWSAGHRGVDLAARAGQPVTAPAAGVVHFVGVVAGRSVVSIAHPGGLISSFEPVGSSLVRGDEVAAEAVLGTVSVLPGHCSPAACVHWGVRRDGVYVDPLSLVGDIRRPIVLKPLAGLS